VITNQDVCVNAFFPESTHETILKVRCNIVIDKLAAVNNITQMNACFDVVFF
jgi:hypothetical protein